MSRLKLFNRITGFFLLADNKHDFFVFSLSHPYHDFDHVSFRLRDSSLLNKFLSIYINLYRSSNLNSLEFDSYASL